VRRRCQRPCSFFYSSVLILTGNFFAREKDQCGAGANGLTLAGKCQKRPIYVMLCYVMSYCIKLYYVKIIRGHAVFLSIHDQKKRETEKMKKKQRRCGSGSWSPCATTNLSSTLPVPMYVYLCVFTYIYVSMHKSIYIYVFCKTHSIHIPVRLHINN
jgi:hypothetical protein